MVLQSDAFGRGGKIIAFDTEDPVKIVELARQFIEMKG